jgi:hypothetical protein
MEQQAEQQKVIAIYSDTLSAGETDVPPPTSQHEDIVHGEGTDVVVVVTTDSCADAQLLKAGTHRLRHQLQHASMHGALQPLAQTGRTLCVAQSWDLTELAAWLDHKRLRPVAWIIGAHHPRFHCATGLHAMTWLTAMSWIHVFLRWPQSVCSAGLLAVARGVPTACFTCADAMHGVRSGQLLQANIEDAIVFEAQELPVAAWAAVPMLVDLALMSTTVHGAWCRALSDVPFLGDVTYMATAVRTGRGDGCARTRAEQERALAREATFAAQANELKRANLERRRRGEGRLGWSAAVEHLYAKGLLADPDTKADTLSRRLRGRMRDKDPSAAGAKRSRESDE